MNKAEIRRRILGLRKLYPQDDIIKNSEIICGKILKSAHYRNAEKIMLYIPMAGEVLTDLLINGKKAVFAPRVRGDGGMDAVRLSGEFTKSGFGVSEPVGDDVTAAEEIDLFIVPGVAFDRDCQRMGFGRGYYDRFLAGTGGYKAGIAFEFQIVQTTLPEVHDVPMDIVFTEKREITKR